jgi:hypothetical protein
VIPRIYPPPHRSLSSAPKGQPYQCKKQVSSQFNFATPPQNSRDQHCEITTYLVEQTKAADLRHSALRRSPVATIFPAV